MAFSHGLTVTAHFRFCLECIRFPLRPPQIPDMTSGTSMLGPRLSTSPMSLGTAPFSQQTVNLSAFNLAYFDKEVFLSMLSVLFLIISFILFVFLDFLPLLIWVHSIWRTLIKKFLPLLI